MKRRSATLLAALALSVSAPVLSQRPATSAPQQFIPVLSYRTGPYGPNGAPWANGFVDYLKLTNARGGIHGVRLSWEECETAYATDRSLECYERLTSAHKHSAFVQPLSTGAVYAIGEKAPRDKVPLVTVGYGPSEAADGTVFKWNFPLAGNYWVAADAIVQDIARREGGLSALRGKKLVLIYHDSPYGKEPIALLQERSRMHGFDLQLLPVAAPGIEQRSAWLQIRQQRPDYVLLWGWGVMNSAALREAQQMGFARDHLYGAWWSGSEQDVKDVSESAKGYRAVALQHGAEPESRVVREILAQVHDKGQGTGPRIEVGQVLYMRGVMSAMLGLEGIRAAQERFGKGKVMTGDQVRWGLENLNLTAPKLDALGFAGVMRPISTSCVDHMGASWARIHTWDGSGWRFSSDWIQADEQILKPLVKSTATKWAADKKQIPRAPTDCQS